MHRLSIAGAALAIAAGAAGVELPFSVEAPSWTEYAAAAEAPDKPALLRQSPSAQAQVAIYDESTTINPDGTVTDGLRWASASASDHAARALLTGFAPVAEKQDGWLRLAGAGPQGSDAWVDASTVATDKITPLGEYDRVVVMDSDDGTYGIYGDYDEMDDAVTFYVGRFSGGFLVCPYVLQIGAIDRTGTSPADAGLMEDEGMLSLVLTPSMTADDEGPLMTVFSDDLLNDIIDAAEAAPRTEILYGGAKGELIPLY